MDMMSYQQLAHQEFNEAMHQSFWRGLFSLVTGKPTDLQSLTEIPVQGQHYVGLRTIPLNQIVGSEGRAHEFDRAFFPRQDYSKERWVNIDVAYHQKKNLPPVELLKMGEVYFVRDGNHRISVARVHGQEFIEADVSEIITTGLAAPCRMC